MGNWMTVNIVGKCDAAEVQTLSKSIDAGEEYDNFHCLCDARGICGLGNWAAEIIDATGNLAERDYTVNCVAEQLQKLAAIAPSLAVDINCGGDHEELNCVATVRLRDGKVETLPPQIETLPQISPSSMRANLVKALRR